MKKYNIGVVGASGLVGRKIIEILDEEKLLENSNLFLYVSKRSAGKVINYSNIEYKLMLLDENALNNKFDIVFFSAGDDVSKMWVEKLKNTGAYIIDNTNAFRRKKEVPLIVPEINITNINKNTKIIANPNCSTIQLALVIDRLLKVEDIEKIVVSTYQSVSGAGNQALNDLEQGTNFKIKEGIKDNVVLKIGDIDKNGYCSEENKIMFELNKILEKNISVCASTVRIPVPYCHTENIYVKFSKNVNFENILSKLYTDYLKIEKNDCNLKDITDTNLTHICRLRKFTENEIIFFIIADNIRRGAAYNAVKIAQYIITNLLT